MCLLRRPFSFDYEGTAKTIRVVVWSGDGAEEEKREKLLIKR
jgi:hypothetical protein